MKRNFSIACNKALIRASTIWISPISNKSSMLRKKRKRISRRRKGPTLKETMERKTILRMMTQSLEEIWTAMKRKVKMS